jgi:hypothetical protein
MAEEISMSNKTSYLSWFKSHDTDGFCVAEDIVVDIEVVDGSNDTVVSVILQKS